MDGGISNFWTTGGGHVWPRERVERAARALCACVECWRGRATPRVLYSYFRLSPLASLDPPVSLRITPRAPAPDGVIQVSA